MKKTLEANANMGFADIDDKKIRHIEDIRIDTEASVEERIKEYVTVTDNPYFLYIDGAKVKFSFRATGPDIQDVYRTLIK